MYEFRSSHSAPRFDNKLESKKTESSAENKRDKKSATPTSFNCAWSFELARAIYRTIFADPFASSRERVNRYRANRSLKQTRKVSNGTCSIVELIRCTEKRINRSIYPVERGRVGAHREREINTLSRRISWKFASTGGFRPAFHRYRQK